MPCKVNPEQRTLPDPRAKQQAQMMGRRYCCAQNPEPINLAYTNVRETWAKYGFKGRNDEALHEATQQRKITELRALCSHLANASGPERESLINQIISISQALENTHDRRS